MKHQKRFLERRDGIDYYCFKPSLFRLYDKVYTRQEAPPYFRRLIHHIRMMRELIRSDYRVIYLVVGGNTIGHLVVGRGGTRVAMSSQEDIVIGPVWTIPSQRNQGYASKGIHFALHNAEFQYVNAYEYIKQSNRASIRTVEKNGFVLVARCAEHGLMRTLREDQKGDQLVYRYATGD